jgi:hypothetical protein
MLRKSRSSLRYSLILSMSLISISIASSPSIAGTRYCYSYPGSNDWCVDEKGSRIDCINYGSSFSVCTGKNNYRKECKSVSDSDVCNDSNGVRTICKSSNSGGVCENSKGYRTICKHIDANRTVCTDVNRWGKPIKN